MKMSNTIDGTTVTVDSDALGTLTLQKLTAIIHVVSSKQRCTRELACRFNKAVGEIYGEIFCAETVKPEEVKPAEKLAPDTSKPTKVVAMTCYCGANFYSGDSIALVGWMSEHLACTARAGKEPFRKLKPDA
jgi:hypothetical protein